MVEKDKLVRMVKALQAGKDGAFEDIWNTFYQDVYYFIKKTVGDPTLAEDLTQNTFMEILQTVDKLKEPAAFVTWSRQIAYHQCTGHFKKTREITVDEDPEGYSVFDTLENENEEFIPGEALDKEDLKKTIHEMIDSLPEDQRAAILLQFYDELSVKDIAKIQNVSEGTVKSRLNYARKSIKKSVEEYEKKHGIKLHCAGVIPLLLWLFRETTGVHTATSAATTAATVVSAADTAKTVGTVAKEGAKAAGKFAAKKIVAGVVAASVVAGGATTAAVMLKPEEPAPMVWTGYGEMFHYGNRRFELRVEEMDNGQISGHINVSYLYESEHDSDFSGKGKEEENVVVYDIVFDDPLVEGILNTEFEGIQLRYDKEDDEMEMEDFYEVTMDRQSTEASKLLEENVTWAGDGEDSACSPFSDDHRFELQVEELREDTITGRLILTHSGEAEHDTIFTGRGFKKNGKFYYEIKLDTPRHVESIIDVDIGSFWLVYDPVADTFTFGELVGFYEAIMTRQK